MITSGLHPIGQAAIAISLAEKCTVYVIVNSSDEAEQLFNTFPEVIIKILKKIVVFKIKTILIYKLLSK